MPWIGKAFSPRIMLNAHNGLFSTLLHLEKSIVIYLGIHCKDRVRGRLRLLKKKVILGAISFIFAAVLLSVATFSDVIIMSYGEFGFHIPIHIQLSSYLYDLVKWDGFSIFSLVLGLIGAMFTIIAFTGVGDFGRNQESKKTPSFLYSMTIGMVCFIAYYAIRLYIVLFQLSLWNAAPSAESILIEASIMTFYNSGSFLLIAGIFFTFIIGILSWLRELKEIIPRAVKIQSALVMLLGALWIGLVMAYLFLPIGPFTVDSFFSFYPLLVALLATFSFSSLLVSMALLMIWQNQEGMKQIQIGVSAIGATASLFIGIFIAVSLAANLRSGIFFILPNQLSDFSYVINLSTDWFFAGIFKEMYAVFGILFVLLLIPAACGIAANLKVSLGKTGKVAMISILMGSILLLSHYLMAQQFPGPGTPITERTPPAAFPGIAAELRGSLILMNSYLLWGGLLTFSLGFGLLALKLKRSEAPRGLWMLGGIQGLIGISWLGLLFSDPIYSISMMFATSGLYIFGIWMFLLSSISLRRVFHDAAPLLKGSSFILILTSAFLILTIFTSYITGLWNIVYEGGRLLVGQLGEFIFQLNLLAVLGLLSFLLLSIASFGYLSVWKNQSGKKRIMSFIGPFIGSLLIFCAYALILNLSQLATPISYRISGDPLAWRAQLETETNTTLLIMEILLITGYCLIFLFGNVLSGILHKEQVLPSIFGRVNIILGLVGLLWLVLQAILINWPLLIFSPFFQIGPLLVCVSSILMAVGIVRSREPLDNVESVSQ